MAFQNYSECLSTFQKFKGGVMDIQKEREAFEAWYCRNHTGLKQSDLAKFRTLSGYSFSDSLKINVSWEAWQAATAQAVPEGFVLAKKVHPDAIVHNQGLGLFKECQIIYGWDGKSKDFKDALNKGFYHGVKLGAKAVLETAMIEAQEQSHE